MSEPVLLPEPADAGLRDTVLRGEPAAGAEHVHAGALVADRYRLVERIGKGGMAEIWRAVHEELRTEVAIKLLAPDLAGDPELAPLALARFRFEAQVSARLSGKTRHVVAVHDAGSHGGTPYLAMELIRGHDLERELAVRGPLDPARVATLLDQVADALDTAHSMGIVHRDIKPSNLLFTEGAAGSGEGLFVKLADFGIAKATQARGSFDLPRVTAAGILVGSPAFMSPEQANGNNDLSGASDIWSLGVVVYEILTGKSCFEGNSLTAVLVSVVSRKFVPLSQARPSLGTAFDAWLDRCLALQPSQRFQTVAELSRAFRVALSKAPGAATASAPSGGRLRAALPVLAALAALAAVAYMFFGQPSRSTAPSAAAAPALSPSAARSSAPDVGSPEPPSVGPTLTPEPPAPTSTHTDPPRTTARPSAAPPPRRTSPSRTSSSLPPKAISPSEIH